MLDPAFIRDHVEQVRNGLRNRGLDADKALEDIATLESLRKRLIGEFEGLKRQQNTSGDEIAKAKRQGQDTAHIQEAGRQRNQQIKQLGVQLDSIEHQRDAALLTLPNLPHASVPVGQERRRQSGSAAPRRAARVRLRAQGRTGTSAPRSASSTSSAPRRSPARGSRC